MTIAIPNEPMSVEQYAEWSETPADTVRCELVEGEVVVAMALSTARTDAWRKTREHLSLPTVQYHLIVDPCQKSGHHYRAQLGADSPKTRVIHESATFSFDPPGISVDVASFFERQMS